jgi:probable addiction module antidote protein
MTKKIRVSELPEFDMTEHLDDEQAIAEYLTIVMEENDPSALAQALGTVARARGMSEIAKAAGLGREALYKALRPGAQPRFDAVQRVCAALGVRLTAVPA